MCGGRARVRVHIPIVTNKQVVFSCGQRGDEVRLHMKAGRAYLFDNHLGHAVHNDGSTPRVHLTVDLVGSRRFWELVRLSRRISSFRSRDSAAVASPWRVQPPSADALPPPLLVERWADAQLVQPRAAGRHSKSARCSGCDQLSAAIIETARPLLNASGSAALGEVMVAWQRSVTEPTERASRTAEVEALQRAVASWACASDRAVAQHAPYDTPTVADIADSVAEFHR